MVSDPSIISKQALELGFCETSRPIFLVVSELHG
jgi:hypothetical protein